jgi:hypothetical protein
MKEVELALTPPYIKLGLTWEKEEGRRLTDEEFKERLRVYLGRRRRPRRKLDPHLDRTIRKLKR